MSDVHEESTQYDTGAYIYGNNMCQKVICCTEGLTQKNVLQVVIFLNSLAGILLGAATLCSLKLQNKSLQHYTTKVIYSFYDTVILRKDKNKNVIYTSCDMSRR